MIFVLIFIFFLIFKNCRIFSFTNENQFNSEYISREFTQTINGIFVILVFLNHFSQYIAEVYVFDKVVLQFLKLLGQCVNCSFLFYSGFGICEQLKFNKNEYCKKLIKIRFPKLLLRFMICVFVYLILSFIFEKNYSIKQILLAFVGLESIGNSSWYIFYILLSYVLVYFSFIIFNNQIFAVISFNVLMILYTLFMFYFFPEKNAYYLTTLIFPLGMYFSLFKDKIQIFLKKNYLVCLILSFVLYFISFLFRHKFNLSGIFYNFTAICFSLILIVLTFKVQIKSKILSFLGNNIFYIYILQRIPMICCSEIVRGGVQKNSYLLIMIFCFAITLLLSYLFKTIFEKIHL